MGAGGECHAGNTACVPLQHARAGAVRQRPRTAHAQKAPLRLVLPNQDKLDNAPNPKHQAPWESVRSQPSNRPAELSRTLLAGRETSSIKATPPRVTHASGLIDVTWEVWVQQKSFNPHRPCCSPLNTTSSQPAATEPQAHHMMPLSSAGSCADSSVDQSAVTAVIDLLAPCCTSCQCTALVLWHAGRDHTLHI